WSVHAVLRIGYHSRTSSLCLTSYTIFFFYHRYRDHRDLHSFPTRRSSDLDSHADCYQYFCVPEYGTANGRLHFHAVHFMRTLPTGSVDPNFGRRVRNRRQLNSLQNTWPYGYSMPIAVRYTQD